jgi:hypothetical protein
VEKYRTATQATDNILRRMRFACWIAKATNTGSEYVILVLITSPRQPWSRKRDSLLYVHCLSCSNQTRAELTLFIAKVSRSRKYNYVMSCSVWLEIDINLILGLLQTEQLNSVC